MIYLCPVRYPDFVPTSYLLFSGLVTRNANFQGKLSTLKESLGRTWQAQITNHVGGFSNGCGKNVMILSMVVLSLLTTLLL